MRLNAVVKIRNVWAAFIVGQRAQSTTQLIKFQYSLFSIQYENANIARVTQKKIKTKSIVGPHRKKRVLLSVPLNYHKMLSTCKFNCCCCFKVVRSGEKLNESTEIHANQSIKLINNVVTKTVD